jgi:hypothetical protein
LGAADAEGGHPSRTGTITLRAAIYCEQHGTTIASILSYVGAPVRVWQQDLLLAYIAGGLGTRRDGSRDCRNHNGFLGKSSGRCLPLTEIKRSSQGAFTEGTPTGIRKVRNIIYDNGF